MNYNPDELCAERIGELSAHEIIIKQSRLIYEMTKALGELDKRVSSLETEMTNKLFRVGVEDE